MKNNSTTARLVLAALLAGFAVSACNTVEGVGKDTEAAGEEIQDAANDSR